MTTQKLAQTTRTQLAGAAAAIAGLASGTYVAVGTIVHNASGKVPLSCIVELSVTPGTVASNKQVLLFAQASLDNIAFGTGPVSGTTTTDESNLKLIGALKLNSNSTLQRDTFSIEMAMPGCVLPYATKLILKNESGAALTSGDVYTIDNSGDSV